MTPSEQWWAFAAALSRRARLFGDDPQYDKARTAVMTCGLAASDIANKLEDLEEKERLDHAKRVSQDADELGPTGLPGVVRTPGRPK